VEPSKAVTPAAKPPAPPQDRVAGKIKPVSSVSSNALRSQPHLPSVSYVNNVHNTEGDNAMQLPNIREDEVTYQAVGEGIRNEHSLVSQPVPVVISGDSVEISPASFALVSSGVMTAARTHVNIAISLIKSDQIGAHNGPAVQSAQQLARDLECCASRLDVLLSNHGESFR
jgi:hypothetical protein